MKEFKGTPGPWFITGSMTKYIEARIDGGMIQEVAACGPTHEDNGYGAQQNANANLIAAAPELLEALQGLLKNHVDLISSGDCGNWDVEQEPEVIAARLAIKKAFGE